jgi:hypothetical protein
MEASMTKRGLFLTAAVLVGLAIARFDPPRRLVAQHAPPQPPAAPRWQVFHAETSMSENHFVRNTLLVDTVTGDTWILWTNEVGDRPYKWVKVERGE